MQLIDVIILLPLLYGFYKGYRQGLIYELISLISLFVAVYCAFKFSFIATHYVQSNGWISEQYSSIVGFVLTFILAIILIQFVGKMINTFIKALKLTTVNKLLGGCFGALKLFVFVSAFLLAIDAANEKFAFIEPSVLEASVLYKPAVSVAQVLVPYVRGLF